MWNPFKKKLTEPLKPDIEPQGNALKELWRGLSSILRPLGYKGSGQNFRKIEGDYIFVVNFQRSSDGIHFYINVGGQPIFVLDEGNCKPNIKTLKEYECIFRKRIGGTQERDQSEAQLIALRAELERSVINFEGIVLKTREVIATLTEKEVVRTLPFGCPYPRAALHIARLCLVENDQDRAKVYAEYGLSLASSDATILIYDLKQVIDANLTH